MNRKQGFTLIELIVVMAILALLLAAGLGAFTISLVKGRDNTRKANLRAITNVLELYYNDKRMYPKATAGSISGCLNATGYTGTCGKDHPIFEDPLVASTIYMAQFPSDPVSMQQYYYVAPGVMPQQYQIYAHLENGQDSQIDPTIAAKGYNCASSGTAVCNYGLSSGNITPSQ